MKKLFGFLFIIFLLNMVFCFAEDDATRGSVTLRWEYVQASTGGYAIYLWDGYAYREVDRVHQEVLEWDSDEAKIYPDEETIALYDENSVTQSLFKSKGRGNRLRNNPNSLYRIMADGTEHSYEEYKDQYLFKIATINEFGEQVFSAPIVVRMDNWEEVNEPPVVTLLINNGDAKTTNSEVELNITAKDDTTKPTSLLMRFANDKKDNLKSAKWEKYNTIKKWGLSEGYGEKTVFVEVKDVNNGNTITSDKIILEKIEKVDFEVVTENNAHATMLDNVTLIIKGLENISDYNCSYVIDDVEKAIEIDTENKIKVVLSKKNKNEIKIKLQSKDGYRAGESEIIIWKLA